MAQTLLCIGTKKGLFLARSGDRVHWEVEGPHFLMNAVHAVAVDTRAGHARVLVGTDSPHLGPSVAHSDDLGASWSEARTGAVRFPEGYGASVERVWQIAPAGPQRPGVVYVGAEPSSLWVSEDSGENFSLVEGLWQHPHREGWQPGYGGQCLHTVIPDPEDPDRVLVAMSTGGVYRTQDGGRSWDPSNTGVQAYFLPDPYPEWGQCVHKVAADAERPGRYYLQNHGGVYRSDDGGRSWRSIAAGLPAEFGFAIAAHPRRGGTAYCFPLEADADRVPAGRRCRIYRTDDAGESWRALDKGLPQGDHYGIVLRDALAVDDGEPAGVYFGTRNGEVHASADEGETWHPVADHLPDVLCVRAATLPG